VLIAHSRLPSEHLFILGPTYVSARSADVILGEVRPIKLKADALRCINVLLDELLWSLLVEARSLLPDRLNSSLRRVLPTALGKEALLEAEVELRAYLEKSPPFAVPNDEEEFSVQYAFEVRAFYLLRALPLD
jgi:hypothetical protein